MKKILIVVGCAVSMQMAVAQRSSTFIAPDRLFQEGKVMFNDRNYAGCYDKLVQYRSAEDCKNQEEAAFLLAACEYYTGSEKALLNLKEFLDTYPATIHKNEAQFMIGSLHFAEGDYTKAIFWLNEADLDYLSPQQQEEYAYRMGRACLETSRYDEAKRLFGLLKNNRSSYTNEATYFLGYIAYKEGDYSEALRQFNQLKDHPEFKEDIVYYTAQINFAQGRYQQTITDGKNILATYPRNAKNGEINRIIGQSYFQENNYNEAINYLEQAKTSGTPLGQADYYSLGVAYYSYKQYDKAIENLRASNPGNDALGQNTYLLLGQAYLQKNDDRNALMAFESASRGDFDPQVKEAAMYNYAMLLHKNSTSAFGESVTVLENFVNTYPNSIYTDRVNDALVDVYLTTKNYDTALASIAKIRQPGSKILEARQKIYFYKGTVDFTNDLYDSAIQHFTTTTQSGNYALKEKNEAYYWLGESYYKKGEYAQAANYYQTFLNNASKLDELYNTAIYNLAYCDFNQKRFSAAAAGFRRYISLETQKSATLADAYARLGDCYFDSRQFALAEEAYAKATEMVPATGAYALFQKGYVMGLQKDYTGKITQMDRLVSTYPSSPFVPEALYEKGRSFVMLENSQSAINVYQSLWNTYPDSPFARKAGMQIGMLYFNEKQNEKSAEAYKRVIKDYPGSQEAKVAVQDLKSVYFNMNDIDGYAAYVRSLGGAARFDVSEQDSLTYLAAERFFMRGEMAQAKENLTRYLQSYPNGAFSTNAHYYLASSYYKESNFSAAKTEFEKVLAAGNNQFTEESVARLAEITYNSQQYTEALQYYQRLQSIAATEANQQVATLGVLRSAWHTKEYATIINSANKLTTNASLDPGVLSEARYYRAKALLASGEAKGAEADLKELAKDTRTVQGAEAKYLLAQYYFDSKQQEKAKAEVMEYIQQGTPHSYWMARSFILMSDIYSAEGDTLQARQYLESLQSNYTQAEDGIRTLVNERLTNLK